MLRSLSRFLWTKHKGISIRSIDRSFPRRHLGSASGGNNDGKDPGPTDSENAAEDVEEEEDEFAMEGFEFQDDEEVDLKSALDAISQEGEEITPELASDLVARMVEATTRRIDKPRHGGNIIPYISSHTVSVMRASRITTNDIQAAGSDYLPHAIEKKVTAEVNVELLGLSRTAREVLKLLSGPRWKGPFIKLSCNQYPSMQENRVHIVSQIDKLVAAAKTCVGEEVDITPLGKWSEVVGEVQRQAKEEIEEAGNVSAVLGEAKA